jgi:hypothetical protein
MVVGALLLVTYDGCMFVVVVVGKGRDDGCVRMEWNGNVRVAATVRFVRMYLE